MLEQTITENCPLVEFDLPSLKMRLFCDSLYFQRVNREPRRCGCPALVNIQEILRLQSHSVSRTATDDKVLWLIAIEATIIISINEFELYL